MRRLAILFSAATIFISGCAAGAGSTSIDTARDESYAGQLRLRWFPVPGAEGYRIYAGSDVIAVPASACSRNGVSFNAGICSYDLKLSGTDRPQLRVSAYNQQGESPAVVAPRIGAD